MGDALANAPETEGERLLSLCVLKAFHINLFCSQMPKVFSRPSQLQTSANTICWWTEHDILSLHRLWQPVEGRLIFAHKAINSSLLLANVQLRNVDVCLEFLLRVLSCEEQRIQTVTVPYRTNTWGVALLFVPVSCLFLSWVTQFRLSLPPRKEPFRFPSLPRRRTNSVKASAQNEGSKGPCNRKHLKTLTALSRGLGNKPFKDCSRSCKTWRLSSRIWGSIYLIMDWRIISFRSCYDCLKYRRSWAQRCLLSNITWSSWFDLHFFFYRLPFCDLIVYSMVSTQKSHHVPSSCTMGFFSVVPDEVTQRIKFSSRN